MGNEFSGAKQKDFENLESAKLEQASSSEEEEEEEGEERMSLNIFDSTTEEEDMGEDEADTDDPEKLRFIIITLRQKNGDMKRRLRSYREKIVELERNTKEMNKNMKKYAKEKIKRLQNSKKDLEKKMVVIETEKDVEKKLFENVEKLAREKERLETEIHNTKLERIQSMRFQSKRGNIIREFFFTEKNYVDDLVLLKIEYLKPLSTFKIMSRKSYEKMTIFKAFDTIFTLNKKFLSRLEETVFAHEREEALVDLIIDFCDTFKLYNEYIKNFGTSQKVFNVQLEKNKKLVKFLDDTAQKLRERFLTEGEKGVRDVNIHGLLITPIQRLPRYLLLLKDLHKYTRKTSERYKKLGKVIDKLESIVSFCNESSKEYENSLKLIDLSKKLNISLIQKQYIMEKKVMRINSTKKLRPTLIYLFNDLLVVHQVKGGILNQLKKAGQNKQWNIHFLDKEKNHGALKSVKNCKRDDGVDGEMMVVGIEGYENGMKIVWTRPRDQKDVILKINEMRKSVGLSVFSMK